MDCEIEEAAKGATKPVLYLDDKESTNFALSYVNEAFNRRVSMQEFEQFFSGDPFAHYLERVGKGQDVVLSYLNHSEESEAPAGLTSKEFYEPIIKRRNEAWLPKLKKSFANGKAFVAVGYGHMMGPSSLVTLLKADGYDVQPADSCAFN